MKQDFVEFLSPGTFVSESTRKPIDSWDVDAAKAMASEIVERHAAKPYGFRFLTRERGADDLDSKVTQTSGIYYLGGTLRTAEEVLASDDPREAILRSNIRGNGIERIIVNTNSWKFTNEFTSKDTLLDWPA